MELRKFVAPECVFGVDARLLVASYASKLGARKALVVTDPGVIAMGWARDVTAQLTAAGVPFAVFDSVTPNPRAEEVALGADVYRAEDCNCIIAVGGGSPMDCAKGIGIVTTNNLPILEFEGVDQVTHPIPPLICIPTTGGSSADVSQFAIIEDIRRRVKVAIISKAIVPDVSLIDPVTLTSMSSELSADTGLDALTHAIEAYVSNAQSAITDPLALHAIRLISAYLPATISERGEVKYRAQIAVACMDAGLAFSNAGLGLVHAMAHSLGGLLDTAHGRSNALLLPHVVNYNYPYAEERFRTIGEAMGLNMGGLSSEHALKELLSGLAALREAVGVFGGLRQQGVREADIPALAENAMEDPDIATNPRIPTVREIEEVYERAL
ncbi:MAG TPA: alcohol dehydrogenase-like regulatory protein ErcA [Armatimonadota bacterium]